MGIDIRRTLQVILLLLPLGIVSGRLQTETYTGYRKHFSLILLYFSISIGRDIVRIFFEAGRGARQGSRAQRNKRFYKVLGYNSKKPATN